MKTLEAHSPDKPNILFIDDEVRILRSLRLMFRRTHNVYTTTEPDEFRQLILAHTMDVVVCDQRMPKITGTELLQEVSETAPNAMRILLTGYADLAAVIDAINKGQIYRYITKPWNADELKQIIDEATQIAQSSHNVSITAPPATTAHGKIKLMVMFENEVIYQRFCSQFGHRYEVFWAHNINATMEILEKQDIAVVITDVHFCNEEIIPIVNALKHISPQIMVIVITTHQDSGMLIRLINQGQIFRCLMRPISKDELNQHMEQAVQQYRFLQNNPEAGKRFNVESIPEDNNSHQSEQTGLHTPDPADTAPVDIEEKNQENNSLFTKLLDKIRRGF